MSADVDRVAVPKHYTDEMAKLDRGEKRITIEVFGLDEDVDLSNVTFEFAQHRTHGASRGCRFVVATDAQGRWRSVGLWRVVPGDG